MPNRSPAEVKKFEKPLSPTPNPTLPSAVPIPDWN